MIVRGGGKIPVLVIDNFDSFTFTLVDYLRQLGAHVRVERNDSITVDTAMAMQCPIMISPGPGTPAQAGISVALAGACIAGRQPLLGVCLGHQAIAMALGGQVTRIGPVHGKASPVRHDSSGVFAGLPSPIAATRYHSLAATRLAEPLVANAWSDDGVVMGLRHVAAPVHGVQFHPESIASEHGLGILRNFLSMAAAAA